MIVLLLTSKNEADVLRLNLEHHLSYGVDHVCVADNESDDHTQDVIREFGTHASTAVFHDFAVRQKVRYALLERVRARHRSVAWIGVSDTDEFHWMAGATLPEYLAETPSDVPALTCRQKLFLPTADDAESGPVHHRQRHRTTGPESPLHTSYREGKTFYRAAWLTRIDHEHRSRRLEGEIVSPPAPTVHHYMIRDENQFVMKVRRLTAWRERDGLRSKLWYHKLRRAFGIPLPPHVAGFKSEWWNVYAAGGEEGLRSYYRDTYRLQTRDLPRLIADSAIVEDHAFADWRAAAASAQAGTSLPGSNAS